MRGLFIYRGSLSRLSSNTLTYSCTPKTSDSNSSAKVPALTNILKLHNPTPVIERTPRFDRLLADLAHHQRFRLPRRLGLEHGLCVRVVPHVMPPIVPRGFVAVVM